eukprot:gene8092-1445_t
MGLGYIIYTKLVPPRMARRARKIHDASGTTMALIGHHCLPCTVSEAFSRK